MINVGKSVERYDAFVIALATEVLIVGAGPTGLFLACDLCRRGVSFLIVDRREAPLEASRALNLQGRSLLALDALGVLPDFMANGRVVRAIRSYTEGRLRSRFVLGNNLGRYPHLLTIEQHRTEAILGENLRRMGGRVLRGFELEWLSESSDLVFSRIRSPGDLIRVSSSYVVGCDGADSRVRVLGGIGYTGRDCDVVYHLADVHLNWRLPANEIIWMVGGHTEVVAFPFRCHRSYRLNLWSTAPPVGEGPQGMDLDSWRRVIERLAPCDVRMEGPGTLASYRAGLGLADVFHRGRILLAGDAAYVLPHCSAEGLNLLPLVLTAPGRATEIGEKFSQARSRFFGLHRHTVP